MSSTESGSTLFNMCKKEVAALRRSPVFAMSLGAKELFHTNFFAFVLEYDRSEINGFRDALREAIGIKREEGEQSRCVVFREKYHFDLVVLPLKKDSNQLSGRILVLEAKLKSIPTIGQLFGYNEKLDSGVMFDLPDGIETASSGGKGNTKKFKVQSSTTTSKTLLSSQKLDGIEQVGWNQLLWGKLADDLSDACKDNVDLYLSCLLRDYSGSLCRISSILARAGKLISNSPSLSWTGIVKSAMQFGEIRIHDLLAKYMTSCVVAKLDQQLKESGYQLETGVFYSNSSPGFSVKWHQQTMDREYLSFGIQVQASEVRRFIERFPDKEGRCSADITKYLGAFGDWFFGQCGDLCFEGKRKVAGNVQELKAFGESQFRYSSCKLGSQRLDELQKLIECSYEHFREVSKGIS